MVGSGTNVIGDTDGKVDVIVGVAVLDVDVLLTGGA